jgi:hypothetical protein
MGGDYPVKIPEPLNVRKVSRNTGAAKPAVVLSAEDAQRRASSGSQQKSHLTNGNGTDAGPPKKRVSSWFKRNSKENASGSSFATVTDNSAQSKDTLVDSQASQPNRPISQTTDDTSLRHVQKKKSFGFAFWKGAKDETKMSLAGKQSLCERPSAIHLLIHELDSDPDDVRNRTEKIAKTRNSREHRIMSGTSHSVWSESDGGIRKIEVQQNWLARLFRVKPAMRHLCFNILKRRARQEVAILLREWRKYGVRDVEVDKERNIIFARVGAKNCGFPSP